ncbi:MAG TPA: AMP-binding protein [Candidatus Binatia bacterium]
MSSGSTKLAPKTLTGNVRTPLRRPAISHGLPLLTDNTAPATLADCMIRAAKRSPDKGIVYVRSDGSESFQSYPELIEDAGRILTGLRNLGLQTGDKVILQLENDRDFFMVFWGCILGGFVPVLLSVAEIYRNVDSVARKLYAILLMLDQPLVVASETPGARICALSELFPSPILRLVTVKTLKTNRPAREFYAAEPKDPAIVLLTSGSTANPNAVMQNHRALMDRSAASVQMNGSSVADVSLNWLPIEHVGGIVRFHLGAVYAACQQIQAATGFVLADPLRWLDLIERYRATVTWAPNFAYGLVNAGAKQIANRQWDLSSMRFIMNGGEAIAAKTARRFLTLLGPFGLPSTAMHPAWGMSETSSAATYSDTFSLESTTDDDPFVEVGSPIPGISLRIVDGQNNVVDEPNIGSLQVKGTAVTCGYYGQSHLNRERFTDDGWFVTGDLGFLRDGRLTITGRDHDVVIVNGVNCHSHIIEAIVEEDERVETSYTAACAIGTEGAETEALAIFFHPLSANDDDLLQLLKSVRQRVSRQVGINPEYLVPVNKTDIPKTSIGKIQRSRLKQRLLAGEFDPNLRHARTLLALDTAITPPRTALEHEIAAIWSEVLGRGASDVNRSFFDFGGDSLAAMRIVSRVSDEYRLHLSVASLFECSTVAEMAHLVTSHQDRQVDDTELERLLVELEIMTDAEALRLSERVKGRN